MMRRTSRPAIAPASLVAWRCASLKYAGTVMTAWVTALPRLASASFFSSPRTAALISSGWSVRLAPSGGTARTIALPSFPAATANGQRRSSPLTLASDAPRPMSRFAS